MRPCFCLAALPALLAAQTPLAPKITRVRVHPDEAWVTRQATARVEGAGNLAFVMRNLPAGLRPEDVRLRAQGPSGFALGDVSVHAVSVPQSGDPSLVAKRRTRLDDLEAKVEGLKVEEAFLRRMLEQRAGEAGTRLYEQPSATQAAMDAARQVQTRLEENLVKARRLQSDLSAAKLELGSAERSVQWLSQHPQVSSEVRFEVRSPGAGTVQVTLETRTSEARWKPDYEAQFGGDGRQAELSLLATVTQYSGEDWEGVALELTTAPARQVKTQSRPLRAVDVGWNAPVQRAREMVLQCEVRSAEFPLTSQAAAPAPDTPAVPMLGPASKVLLNAPGLATTFLLDGAKRVPSQTHGQRFLVRRVVVQPELVRIAMPRVTREVLLTARFPMPEELPFFPGADLVPLYGGQRLGAVSLQRPAPGEPFSLTLGAFEGLQARLDRVEATHPHRIQQVVRQRGEEIREEIGVGRIQQWKLQEQMLVENTTGDDLTVEIWDRPVRSVHEKVQVSFQARPKPDQSTVERHIWRVNVPARSRTTLTLDTSVKGPKEGHATGMAELGLTEE